MPLPLDTSGMQIVVAEPCAPRRDRQTGEQRTDGRTGLPIWDTGLLIGDGNEVTALRVKTFTENNVPQLTPVAVSGLCLTILTINGDVIYMFSADAIIPATGGEWGPAPATSPAASSGADPAGGKSSGSSGSSGSRGGGSGSPGSQGAAGKAGA